MSITVNYASLQNASDAVNDAARLMDGKLEDIEAEVRQLCETWEGDARESFQTVQGQLNEAQRQLVQVLNQMEAAIIQANERYGQGEKAITDSFTG